MSTGKVREGVVLLCSCVCIALVLTLVAPQKAEAQVLYGSIVGNVKDSTGAVVPRASGIEVSKKRFAPAWESPIGLQTAL